MLLSNQQKYIISVLRQIKYIRSCQLCALTAQHYRPQGIEISQHRMDVMLRQLRAGTNSVRLQEDIVCYGKCTVDPRFFASERLESPFLLRFAGSGEELSYLFTVAWMDTPERIHATSRMKGERIIWISDRRDSRGIALPRHHIFAVRQEDGTHRFFGSHEPEKI